MKDKNPEVLESLKLTLDTAKWSWLAPHQARGAVILVNAELDLLEVAYQIATDDKPHIQKLIETQSLVRPNAQQLASWETIPDKPFGVIVVQPYVLAQEKPLH